ncbi:MAG: TetR/AcrR family transcriptional regulator [Sphingomonadales bacterium]|nr:TetR/AcrR family transcriptional regulator [Sphingomonadales bacterium]
MPQSASVKYQTPLRQAQRDLTRSRIKNAARELFHDQHYDTTTMDEIAVAAGLRRSTLYLHYKDKAQILADVVADYRPRAQAVLATLPGPAPTVEQVRRWIRKVIAFVEKERVPLSIITEMKRDRANSATLDALTSDLLAALGENNPPIASAARSDADPLHRARALLLFQELTFTCEQALMRPGDDHAKALVDVTADHFHAFLR